MKIALLGASGRIGQRITLEALVRGHEVKALVRNPQSFPIAHPRLTVARVDIFDPASVAEVISDSDVLVNATGAGGSDPHTFYVNSTKSAIAWTFFSPSEHIAPGRRTGKYRLGTDHLLTNDEGESFISMEDYAVALLDEIERPRFIRQRFTAVSLEK